MYATPALTPVAGGCQYFDQKIHTIILSLNYASKGSNISNNRFEFAIPDVALGTLNDLELLCTSRVYRDFVFHFTFRMARLPI